MLKKNPSISGLSMLCKEQLEKHDYLSWAIYHASLQQQSSQSLAKTALCYYSEKSHILQLRVFPSGGGNWGDPHELYVPSHNSCVPPHKIENLSPLISVDHNKIFFRYFFNLCMTKANLTSITSLRMQLYCLIEILKQQQLKSLK